MVAPLSRARAIAVLCLGSLALIACGGQPAAPAAATAAVSTASAASATAAALPKTLTIGLDGDFTTLDGTIRVDTNDRILY
ncbi:MAG TPA: hypothetical protein VNM16_01940, partial [Bacillota bacterium]|nr:hypothetical protein [Bacillota bacterium]